MGRHYYLLISNVACYLLIVCVVDFRPLVIGGLFKLIACAVLACLLAFVIVHTANIRRLVVACVQALPSSRVPLVVARRWVEQPPTTITVSNEPSLSPLFQRPPPVLSL